MRRQYIYLNIFLRNTDIYYIIIIIITYIINNNNDNNNNNNNDIFIIIIIIYYYKTKIQIVIRMHDVAHNKYNNNIIIKISVFCVNFQYYQLIAMPINCKSLLHIHVCLTSTILVKNCSVLEPNFLSCDRTDDVIWTLLPFFGTWKLF